MRDEAASPDERVRAYLDSSWGPHEEIGELIRSEHLRFETHLDLVRRFEWERWDPGEYAQRVVDDYRVANAAADAARILETLLPNLRASRSPAFYRALSGLPDDVARDLATPILERIEKAVDDTMAGEMLRGLDDVPLGGTGSREAPTDLDWIWHEPIYRIWESIRETTALPLESTAALLGLKYRTEPSKLVPDRHFWALMTPWPGNQLLFDLLSPHQTSRILFRAMTSQGWTELMEYAWQLPSFVGHLAEVVVRIPDARLFKRMWGSAHHMRPDGQTLGSLVELAEELLFELGRAPVKYEDNNLKAHALRSMASLIDLVASKLEPDPRS